MAIAKMQAQLLKSKINEIEEFLKIQKQKLNQLESYLYIEEDRA